MNDSYLVSWSGGKDSTLALYRVIKAGVKISCLLNFISEEHKRVRFHGTTASIIGRQASLLGIPLYQKPTGNDDYERCFKDAVNALKPVKGMVFGDIYLDEHRQWVERVCGELGIEAIEPLWGNNTALLIDEFLKAGFEAVIVGGWPEFVDEHWIGKKLSLEFVESIVKRGADPCGEKGEYHTFVTAGPIFRGRIELTCAEPVLRNNYRFLDIKTYRVVNSGSLTL